MKKTILSCISILVLTVSSGFAEELFSFEGRLDFQNSEYTIDVDFKDDSSIKASSLKTAEDYHLKLNLEHVKSPFFDISSQIEGSLEFSQTEDNKQAIFGKLISNYSLVDYKPAKELSGRFEIKDNRIFVRSLSFGDITWNGFIEFVRPYSIDLVVGLDTFPMDKFLSFWGAESAADSSGVVDGEIGLSGTLDQIELKGDLQAYHGHIGKLKYDSILLNTVGTYPKLIVNETIVSKAGGMSFQVDGPVDISDKANFKKQIKALDLSPIISDTASKTEWMIKRVEARDLGSTEFKYLLRKDEGSSSTAEESAMLGVEQKMEF